MSFDPVTFKRQFPLFQQPDNRQLVYLDNAATTQKPQAVIDALAAFYLSANGNAQRASHRLARAATAKLEQTRQQAAVFMGATAEQIVFTTGATMGLNMIAHGWQSHCANHQDIVLSYAEHHANILPWQRLAQQTGARLRFVPLSALSADVLSPHTCLLAVTLASNGLGSLLDVAHLQHIRRLYPQLLIVLDAAQYMAHRVLDVQRLPCDFVVCSAHKFYGPTGVGLLYGRGHRLSQLSPLLVGGEMAAEVSCEHSVYRAGPQRLEAGTSALAAIAGLDACLAFWRQQPREAMLAYEQQLLSYLHRQLGALVQARSEITLLTQAHNNVGIATLAFAPPYSVSDAGAWLDRADIAVRVGQHCAQPLWTSLAVGSTLRISLAAYNTFEDIDRLLNALNDFLLAASPSAVTGETAADETVACDLRARGSGAAWPDDGAIVLHDLGSEDVSAIDWRDLSPPMPWQQRYKWLMRWGQQLRAKPRIRQDRYRIQACEAPVWLCCFQREGRYYFAVDSESKLIKGLAVLLLSRLQGETAEAIRAMDVLGDLQHLSLEQHLSPSRVNGFHGLLTAMLAAVAGRGDGVDSQGIASQVHDENTV